VVIGRDADADIRIVDPRISRAHLILRFEQGKWLAIDNGSVNGTFVNGYRRPVIDIHDGQSINIGNAGGPQLSFELALHPGRAGRPPEAGSPRDTEPSTISWSTPPRPHSPVRTHQARAVARDAAGRGPLHRLRRDSLRPRTRATRHNSRRSTIRPTSMCHGDRRLRRPRR